MWLSGGRLPEFGPAAARAVPFQAMARLRRVGSPFAPALAAALALALVSGCAHESAADRQLARLQEDMGRLTTERDAFDKRLTALEGSRADAPGPKPDDAQDSPGARVDPSSPPTSDDPEDGAPRPSIKVQGQPGFGKARSRRDDPQPDLAATTDPSGSRPSALDPAARKAYDEALEKARSGRHREGLEKMSAFLVKWPDHPYADNAMYWRAECLAALGEPQKAIAELEALVSRFPLGNKVPDALSKLSLLYERQGDAAKAKAASDRLERDFPKSDAAKRRARKSSDRGHERPKDVP
jgi:tol-pal system protein YbgF